MNRQLFSLLIITIILLSCTENQTKVYTKTSNNSDSINSIKPIVKINKDTLIFGNLAMNNLPTEIVFEGKIISSSTWKDKEGEHIAFTTETGEYISKKFNSRRFAKTNNRVIEAQMTDAILVAMSTLSSWDNDEEDIFDGRGLSASQLIRRVANTTKPNWGQMDILNPDVIEDTFSFEEDDEPESETKLENAQQTTEAFDTPGRGRHRSDFISAPIR